ncbi:MAG: TIM barrel protein [Candidatus Aenigmatarchaeota archaeon]
MKIGLKIYPYKENYKFAKKFCDLVDFIEIMAIPGEDYSYLDKFNLPVVVHNMHEGLGINLANPDKRKINRESLDFSTQLADKFDSKFIIVHSGKGENEKCSKEELIEELNLYRDKRIVLENCVFREKEVAYGYDFISMKNIISKTKSGLCLDFPHAYLSAHFLKRDPIKLIKDLTKLKPKIFHISNMYKEEAIDSHNNLCDGNLPIEDLLKFVGKNYVTMETNHDLEKTKMDIIFLRNFIKSTNE